MVKKKKKEDGEVYGDIPMFQLDKEDKRMIRLMKEARNENGSVNWKLFEKLITEDAKSGK